MNTLALRAALNRWRRRLLWPLRFRMLFGERSHGRDLPHTRIAPSTCIEHEHGLRLGDHVFIGHFNLIEAGAGPMDEQELELATTAAWSAAHGLAEMFSFRQFDHLKESLGGDDAFLRGVFEHMGIFGKTHQG